MNPDLKYALNECSMAFVNLSLDDITWTAERDGESNRWYIQVHFDARDPKRPGVLPTHQSGRKWWLSEHMTKSEIVRTIFMAVLACAEHEVREQFYYKDSPVFGPHISVEVLRQVAHIEDKRPEPTT